jgi:hypothetical protein
MLPRPFDIRLPKVHADTLNTRLLSLGQTLKHLVYRFFITVFHHLKHPLPVCVG